MLPIFGFLGKPDDEKSHAFILQVFLHDGDFLFSALVLHNVQITSRRSTVGVVAFGEGNLDLQIELLISRV